MASSLRRRRGLRRAGRRLRGRRNRTAIMPRASSDHGRLVIASSVSSFTGAAASSLPFHACVLPSYGQAIRLIVPDDL